jgi:SAM-dependent methyltransferase
MAHDSKAAERSYLRRAGTADWERTKPFVRPGAAFDPEGLRLIADFAAAVQCLEPRPGDTVLDLGAGACWASAWLRGLGFRTISVDIADEMLGIGRARLGSDALVVAGDLEALPLMAGSADKAICLNALHHLPDPASAIAEVHRVLGPHGAVVFSEPGLGHAVEPHSIRAAQEFGVLEREVRVRDLMRHCAEAGFGHVRIKPLAHVIPFFDLDLETWAAWDARARVRRPRRALQKILAAVLELAGLGKGSTLVEETLGMDLVRVLKHAMEDHPVVVARKQPGDRRGSSG